MLQNSIANHTMKKISIIIPAHNEASRIGKTIDAYAQYFSTRKLQENLDFELVIVLNGCTDTTKEVVAQRCVAWGDYIRLVELSQAGKGLAIRAGFADALSRPATMIGFVDADMATRPEYFYALLAPLATCDGVIASRYMPGAQISPLRPWYKRWGSIIFYESLVRLLFGMRYYDYQCGAKVFNRNVIEVIIPALQENQWAFDVELLYLCKKYCFIIKEVPTVWYDQAGSKLALTSGLRMLSSIIRLRIRH
jgi:glycosyltransferase involved in cell wall biosynthesis